MNDFSGLSGFSNMLGDINRNLSMQTNMNDRDLEEFYFQTPFHEQSLKKQREKFIAARWKIKSLELVFGGGFYLEGYELIQNSENLKWLSFVFLGMDGYTVYRGIFQTEDCCNSKRFIKNKSTADAIEIYFMNNFNTINKDKINDKISKFRSCGEARNSLGEVSI